MNAMLVAVAAFGLLALAAIAWALLERGRATRAEARAWNMSAEAAQDGASVPYWSPWNEPNHPGFLYPQRTACSTAAPSVAAGPYAELAQAMLA